MLEMLIIWLFGMPISANQNRSCKERGSWDTNGSFIWWVGNPKQKKDLQGEGMPSICLFGVSFGLKQKSSKGEVMPMVLFICLSIQSPSL